VAIKHYTIAVHACLIPSPEESGASTAGTKKWYDALMKALSKAPRVNFALQVIQNINDGIIVFGISVSCHINP